MGRKMLMRILSISIALLFLGVFLPSLTNGAVNPTSVEFGEVAVGSQGSQLLSISNSNSLPVSVIFFLSYENGDCGFSLAYEGSALTPDATTGYIYLPEQIAGNGSVNVEVIFAPTEPPATCSAALLVAAGGVARATLSGTGIEAPLKSLTLVIDEQDTGVPDFKYDFKDDEKLFSVKLEEIAAKARTHGQYVWMVVFWTRRVYRDDKIDKEQMKAIIKAAAHAKIPKDGVIKGKKEKHHHGRHAAGFGSHGGHHK